MKALAKNFLNGCLVLVPAVATLYAVYIVFVKIDGLLGLRVPGLGFLVTVVLITLVGALARNVVGKRLVGLPDQVLTRLPLVKLIYTSLRDFMAALVGERKSFDRPVLVSLSADGAVKAFGFITRDDLSAFGLDGYVAVYFPQSVNFAGQLALLPRARVQPLEVPPSELLPFIVSGGMAGGEQPEAEAI
jgi:uncharacterized membrane protein